MSVKGGAVLLPLLLLAEPSYAEDLCSNFSAVGSSLSTEARVPNGPVFPVFMHQHDRDRPQYNKDEFYFKVKPFCRRDDCERYIKELPVSHMSGMDFSFTCEEGSAAP